MSCSVHAVISISCCIFFYLCCTWLWPKNDACTWISDPNFLFSSMALGWVPYIGIQPSDILKGTSRVKYRNSSQSSKSLKEWCCSWSLTLLVPLTGYRTYTFFRWRLYGWFYKYCYIGIICLSFMSNRVIRGHPPVNTKSDISFLKRNFCICCGKTSLRAFLSWISPLIPKLLSVKWPGAPVFKGKGWANCHIKTVLLCANSL